MNALSIRIILFTYFILHIEDDRNVNETKILCVEQVNQKNTKRMNQNKNNSAIENGSRQYSQSHTHTHT